MTSLKFAAPFVFSSYLIEPAICREREFLADEGSVTLTSEPSALISALIKISEAYDVVAKGGFFCGFAMSFFHCSPARGGIFSKHPPLEERLNRLLKLEKACRIRKSDCYRELNGVSDDSLRAHGRLRSH